MPQERLQSEEQNQENLGGVMDFKGIVGKPQGATVVRELQSE